MRYERQKFTDYFSNNRMKVEDIEFIRCDFVHCRIVAKNALSRCILQDVRLLNCSQDRCLIEAPILRDVLVDTLNTRGQMLEVLGAVFDRVVLQGKIDHVWIKPEVVDASMQAQIDEANNELYGDVEWALDISRADFKEADIRGIPADLVRYDPETQGIVTYGKMKEGEWRDLKYEDGLFEIVLDTAADLEDPGAILIAPKRHRNRKALVSDLQMLRKKGIVEPS